MNEYVDNEARKAKLVGKTVTMAHGAEDTDVRADRYDLQSTFDNPDLIRMMQLSWHLRPVRWQYLRMDLSYHRYLYPEEISESFPFAVRSMIFMYGGKPLYLTCAFVIEEDFDGKTEEIAEAMEKTGERSRAGSPGDTKVAGKGQVDGVFITTTGIGDYGWSRSYGKSCKTGRCDHCDRR